MKVGAPGITGIALLAMVLASDPRAGEPQAGNRLELQTYDVRELTNPVTQFRPPVVRLHPVLASDEGQQTLHEEEGSLTLSAADLAALIQERLLPQDFADPATSIEESGGRLVVMQHPGVHKRIAEILTAFRKTVKPHVEIQARFVRAVKLPEATQTTPADTVPDSVIACPRMICRNRQRVQAVTGRLQSYVADMEVSGDRWDPVVAKTLEGCVMDVRPILTQNRKHVELDLHFQMRTNLRREVQTLDLQTAGLDATGKKPPSMATTISAELETPSIDTQEVRTQLRVEKGKWVMAACMNNRDPKTRAKEPYLLLYVTASEWSAK